MKTGAISIQQAIAFAWPTFKRHWRLHVAMLLIMFAAWAILEVVVICGQRLGIVLWIAAHLAFLIFFSSLQVGFLRRCLDLRDQRETAFSKAFAPLPLGIRFFVAQTMYFLMIVVGLALLLAPGIYVAARYAFFGFYITKGSGIGDAFHSSSHLASATIFPIAGALAVLVLFNVLGAALLGIGLLITIPVSGLVWADVFYQLSPAVPSG